MTVDERGIMMENAGPEFEGQFYEKVVPTVIEKLGNLLLPKKKSLTHTHLTGVPRNQSSGVQFHNGLPQFLNSAKKSWMKLKSEIPLRMGKVRLYNMIRDRGDWVISRQRAWGFHFLSSTLKMVQQS